jgi:glycosyltransferase involved in cell wall biosynthesis
LGNLSFSIIIPTYHSPSIQETLSAINRQIADNQNILEVIIVGQQEGIILPDNAKFHYFWVGKNPSPARNRNIGALKANGEWLCFLDSDSIPKKDWLSNILASITPIDNIYVGSVDMGEGMTYWSWCDHLITFGDQVHGIFKGKYLKYATTNNMVVHKNIFHEIGGFDESFSKPAGEDYDFFTHAAKLGQRIVFLDEAIVVHNHIRRRFYDSWKHLFLFGETTIKRRVKYRSELKIFYRIYYSILKIRIIGELLGVTRLIGRVIIRPFHRPKLLKYWRYFPGIFLLDVAHTKGMITYLRTNY